MIKNIMWLLCRELHITVYHWSKKGENPRLSKKKWMLTRTRPSLGFLQLQVPTKCKEAAPGGTCRLVSVLLAWLPSGLSIQNTREQGSSGPHTLGLDCSPGSGGSAKTTEMPCVGPSYLTSKIRPAPASHTSLLEITAFDIFLSTKVKKQSDAGLRGSHFREIQVNIKPSSNTVLPQIKEMMGLHYIPFICYFVKTCTPAQFLL